jgi:hypothetical protein
MPDLIAPTAWSAPAIATTLRKTIQLKEGQTGKLASRQTKPSGTTLTVCRSPLYSRTRAVPALRRQGWT